MIIHYDRGPPSRRPAFAFGPLYFVSFYPQGSQSGVSDNVTHAATVGGAVFATAFHASENAHWPILKTTWGQRDTSYNIPQINPVLAMALQEIGSQATWTDKSGTITTGTVAQTLIALNTARRGYMVQNLSTGNLYINESGNASANQPSITIPPNVMYETPKHGFTNSTVSIYGSTTSQAFSAREFS